MSGASVVWLRDDLRLADNPALSAAADRGLPTVVLYVLDEVSPGIRPLGSASRWWLHHSLASLRDSLAAIGSTLVVRAGPAVDIVSAVVAESGAKAVYCNRRYGSASETDAAVATRLGDLGVEMHSFESALLFEPGSVSTADGRPYRVFTPFWKACRERGVARLPLPEPRLAGGPMLPSDELDLLPQPDWAAGLRATWTPGEPSALERLERFATDGLERYHRRDEPAVVATSRLSPHLRFGELSPLQVWHRIERGQLSAAARANAAGFVRELGWREFTWHTLHAQPDLATRNLRAEFDRFPWRTEPDDDLVAWQRGRTGVPLVDAGMRELWQTGTMHNRVRMVVASFLVKNLLFDWRTGERWFWDCLVDADEANNPGNWQWVAGSGADAAPYFRVFNPVLQAEKFDPAGDYQKRWIPELGTADYPAPIVDLARSRRDALAAYAAARGSA